MTDTPPAEEPTIGPPPEDDVDSQTEPVEEEPVEEKPDPNPPPDREPTETEEPVDIELEPAGPKRKPLRTDAVMRTITTQAPEGILREIRGFPTDAPEWIPAELRPVLGAIWKQIVTEVNKLPEFVDETELVLGDRVVAYVIDTAQPAGAGKFVGLIDGNAVVLLTDGNVGKFPISTFALGRG